MTREVDWGTHIRNTREKYVSRYLTYAEAHNHPTPADYAAIQTELPNVLTGMDRAYRNGQEIQVCRYMEALDASGGYLKARGYWSELCTRLEHAIGIAEARNNTKWIASFTLSLGTLSEFFGEYEKARRLLGQSRDAAEAIGDRVTVTNVLLALGDLAHRNRRYDEAQQLYQQGLKTAREAEHRAGVAKSLCSLAMMARTEGDYGEAIRLYEQSLDNLETDEMFFEIGYEMLLLALSLGGYERAYQSAQVLLRAAEEVGDRLAIGRALFVMGTAAHLTEECAEAQRLYRQSLEAFECLQARREIAAVCHHLGLVAQATEDHVEARQWYRKSLNIKEELGDLSGVAITLGALAGTVEREGDPNEAERLYKQSMTSLQEMGDAINAGICMLNLALFYATHDRQEEAIPLLTQAVEVFEHFGSPHAAEAQAMLYELRIKTKPGCAGWILRREAALYRALRQLQRGMKR